MGSTSSDTPVLEVNYVNLQFRVCLHREGCAGKCPRCMVLGTVYAYEDA